MRIVLLYPPPGRLSSSGPTPGRVDTSDACLAPYGLLSLAAQAIRTGHQVKTLNLSTFPWDQVERLLGELEADVYGLTCFTSNRQGVAACARSIRRHHPSAQVVVGGPHVSALPAETLKYYGAIDTVVIGEGEETFLELLARLGAGEPTTGIAGTAWRDDEGVRLGPPRERIRDLDSLAAVHDYFAYNLLLTSRGCPGRCTFCASGTMWGRKLGFHSVGYVLDCLERVLPRLPSPIVMVKDDTFTANRRRALEVCRGIRDRGLNFLWSCDTRADALDEELLRALRLAGCQQISLGVESASPEILASIRKHVTPEQVLEATRLARKYGLRVRYFMIAGNRGETMETFQRDVAFLEAAQPDEYVFSILTVFPGTEEFEIARRSGRLTAEAFFEQDFPEFWVLPGPKIMERLSADHCGRKSMHAGPSVEQCQAVLHRLPGLHAAHLDLGAACFRAGRLDEAEQHLRRALELGYPVPELAENYLAGVAGRRGNLGALRARLQQAARRERPHRLVVANVGALEAWLEAGGSGSGQRLNLAMRHHFEAVTPECQPIAPAPLPEDCCRWRQHGTVATDCMGARSVAS